MRQIFISNEDKFVLIFNIELFEYIKFIPFFEKFFDSWCAKDTETALRANIQIKNWKIKNGQFIGSVSFWLFSLAYCLGAISFLCFGGLRFQWLRRSRFGSHLQPIKTRRNENLQKFPIFCQAMIHPPE